VLALFIASVFVFHGICLSQCVGEQSHETQKTTPPCHDEGQAPDGGSPVPAHSCSEGSALGTSVSPAMKATLDSVAALGVAITLPQTEANTWAQSQSPVLFPPIASPAHLCVLRV
jgi:hypothetical protein